MARVRVPMALFVVAAVCAACGGDGDDRPSGWHVEGGHIRDAEGRAVILRGANVSNRHKRPPYFDFHGLEDFERMRGWGMNSVRLLVSWAAIEPERGVYDPDYLDAVATRVAWIAEAGLVVIVDMHQDLYGEGFNGNGAPAWTCDQAHYDAYEPIEPWFANYANEHIVACYDGFWSDAELQAHYVEAWRRLAARLADAPAVLGFDPMNEPYWGSLAPSTFEEQVLRDLYVRVTAAVRGEAPGWLAFLEPASSRNFGDRTNLPVFPFDGVVYAPHSYDAQAEAGDGFDPARRAAIVDNLELLREEAGWLDAALWIGEYGGVAGDGGIAEYMDAQYDAAAAVAAGSAYWHYGADDGYAILDADGNEKPALLDALVRPFPERIAGDPRGFAYDETTRTLEVRYTPRADIDAPTQIRVPARVYPEGVDVSCDCAYEVTGDVVEITSPPPPGSDATLTLRPAAAS